MRARLALGLVPLLSLTLVVRAPAQDAPAQDAPAIARSEAALAERWAALREALEADLGAPFDPAPRFVPTTRAEVARVIAAENLEAVSRFDGAPERDVLEPLIEQQASTLAATCFGKVHLAEGHVMVVGETFAGLATAAPELRPLRTARFLDVILLHEAVHVWQHRRFDLGAFVSAARNLEQLQARFCVLEGHAQVVTRRVAERLGLGDEFALFVRANTEVPSSTTDPVLRAALDTMTQVAGFQYVEGEKFVAHVLERLGAEAGVERLFTAPPGSFRAVSSPGEYLDPPADPGVDLQAIGQRALPLMPEGWPAQVVAVPKPALRSALSMAGDEAEAWLNEGHREAVAVTASKPDGSGASMTIAVHACTSPEAAARLVELVEKVSRIKDEEFSKPGGAFRIVSSKSEDDGVGDRPGLFADKRLTTPAGEIGVLSLVVAEGPFVVEMVVVHAPAIDKAAMQEIAGKVLELLPR